MTIEDPVEYVFPSINQIQTNEQAGLTSRPAFGQSFARTRRHSRRRDPRRRDDSRRCSVGIDGPLRGLVASRHRLGVGPPPIPGHGYRVVSHRLIGTGRRRPETPAKDLPVVQGALSALGRRVVFYEESAVRPRTISSREPAATSAPTPATRTGSASMSSSS